MTDGSTAVRKRTSSPGRGDKAAHPRTASATTSTPASSDGERVKRAVSRQSQAEWEPAHDRADPVDVLVQSSEGRVEDLLPIRYSRMAVSPFTFFRGAAAVMAADLATQPTTGFQVQACGDCHLMNFGLFATPERNVVFGLNDFDETMPGPWEWDLKRLVASFVVAGRDVGLKNEEPAAVAAAGARAYRERLWQFSEMSPLEIWYDRIDLANVIEDAPDKAARRRREQLDQQARKRVAENLFPKLVTTEGGRLRIGDQPPLIYHMPELTN